MKDGTGAYIELVDQIVYLHKCLDDSGAKIKRLQWENESLKKRLSRPKWYMKISKLWDWL